MQSNTPKRGKNLAVARLGEIQDNILTPINQRQTPQRIKFSYELFQGTKSAVIWSQGIV